MAHFRKVHRTCESESAIRTVSPSPRYCQNLLELPSFLDIETNSARGSARMSRAPSPWSVLNSLYDPHDSALDNDQEMLKVFRQSYAAKGSIRPSSVSSTSSLASDSSGCSQPSTVSSDSSGSSYSSDSSYTNSKQRCEAVVERLRGEYAEELYIPLAAVSQSTLQYFTSRPIGDDFLIIDKSEFLHHDAPVYMRPGKHGYFVPCSWSLLGHINLHIQSRQRGCHVFISSGEQGAMYHGYYQIQQSDVELTRYEWACFPRRTRMSIAQAYVCHTEHGLDVKGVQKTLRKLDAGEETLKPVFFRYEYFDRRLMYEMECYASRRPMKPKSYDRHDSDFDFMADLIARYTPEGPTDVEVLTVDGITFELSPVHAGFQH